MANCLTCIHQEVCKERMEIFNLPNIACQYEAHELVGEWIPTDEIGSVVRCSRCSYRTCADVAEEEYDFCPKCGSDNRKSGESE